MKLSTMAVALTAFSMTTSVAFASVPATSNITPTMPVQQMLQGSGFQLGTTTANIERPTQPTEIALGATSCQDPNYAWYEYSGIEAMTCLFTGQWGPGGGSDDMEKKLNEIITETN